MEMTGKKCNLRFCATCEPKNLKALNKAAKAYCELKKVTDDKN